QGPQRHPRAARATRRRSRPARHWQPRQHSRAVGHHVASHRLCGRTRARRRAVRDRASRKLGAAAPTDERTGSSGTGRRSHTRVDLYHGVVQVMNRSPPVATAVLSALAVGMTLTAGAAGAKRTPSATAPPTVAAEAKPATAEPMSAAAQRDLIDQYCIKCHNYTDYAGGVEFEVFDPGAAWDEAAVAERMLKKVGAGMMPPAGKARPDFATMKAFAAALESSIDGHAKPNLHVPKLHRLNRAEYANAVRDLLSLELDTTQFLPPDDVSRGFDNQAGTLTLSPALLEAYLSAAARISRLAIGNAAAQTQVTYRVAEDTTQNYRVDGLPFGTRGGIGIDHTFPSDGKYTFKVFSVNLGNMGNFRPFGEIRGEQLLVYVD